MGCGASSTTAATADRGAKGPDAPVFLAIDETAPIHFDATVLPDSTDLPLEFGENDGYYFIVLEVPGMVCAAEEDDGAAASSGSAEQTAAAAASPSNQPRDNEARVNCSVSPTGYLITVSGTRTLASLGPGVLPAEDPKCTRGLGPLRWMCDLKGVFERGPEFNCRDGILKLRFRKRRETKERPVLAAF